MAWRDGELIRADVQGAGMTLRPVPGSAFASKPALSGILVGGDALVLDEGRFFTAYSPSGTKRLEMPPLPPDTSLASLVTAGGGLCATGWQGRTPVQVVLAPASSPPPLGAAPCPIGDGNGGIAGWLLPGPRARIVDVAGTVVELGVPLGLDAMGKRIEGGWLVHHREGGLLQRDGRTTLRLEGSVGFAVDGKRIYVFEPRARRISMVDGDALAPLYQEKSGRGLGGPLSAGAAVERWQFAVHGDRALIIERVRLASCELEDRVYLMELSSAKTRLVLRGDRVRLHPLWAEGRFHFVEAESEYTTVTWDETSTSPP